MLQKVGNRPGCKVYLAEHKQLRSKRIIKCIDKSFPLSQYFLSEACLLNSLTHPEFPVLYDYEENAEAGFLIEEFIKGKSIKNLKKTHTNFSHLQLVTIARDLCRIFMYLHYKKPYPVLYLDLKPEHIIITERGLKLIDFGSAIAKKDKYMIVATKGTKGFASPELFHNRAIDERADIYAIGAVLFWIMTGKTVLQSKESEVKSNIKPGYVKQWNKIVSKCISESKDKRYQCIDSLADKIWLLNQLYVKKPVKACKKQYSKYTRH